MVPFFILSIVLANGFLAALSQGIPQLFSPDIPRKILASYNRLPKSPWRYPQYSDRNGVWQHFQADTWTSGFLPATLYALNTRKVQCGTGSGLGAADWLDLGRKASVGIAGLTTSVAIGHDIGFISFAFVEELALNPNDQTTRNTINRFANDLAQRYNPTVGSIRSWDNWDGAGPNTFKVIIDNMMNLELLFVSADLTGNNTLRQIANKHAETTMKNHIRADGGTFHVVEFNAANGAVSKKETAQGYSDSSTWSRGQAWGLLGFAKMYQRTKNQAYLDTARTLGDYFWRNLPANGIVPWDFNAPASQRPADSSAATIAANAFFILARLESDPTRRQKWIDHGYFILDKITTLAWKPSWPEALLSDGTVNKPAENYLTGTVYGDYYFIEAGNEAVRQKFQNCR